MPGPFSIEELVIDDSFRSFCLQENEADILFWKQYLLEHPAEIDNVNEAKQMVLGLGMMLQQDFGRTGFGKGLVQESIKQIPVSGYGVKKMLRYAAAIAAIFILIFVGRKMVWLFKEQQPQGTNLVANGFASDSTVFTTSKGVKKLFVLPDSTKLWLNASSELRLDKGFGKINRQVYLSGEGLFDVTHNKDLPFIVHVRKYDVKVLGTLFNVKAYPGDKQTETALIRGKVEIIVNGSSRKIMLVPNQKVVMNTLENAPEPNFEKEELAKDAVILLPLSLSARDNSIIETAWSQNRLELVDESFADIKEKLERWYNVKIIFQDEAVSKYRFSATFENESIEQVLLALENAYPFKYDIKGHEVILSK